MENMTMLIDFYEFTMGQTYFDKGEINKKVYFDVFFRKNPFKGGYTISGGIDRIVEYIITASYNSYNRAKYFCLCYSDYDFKLQPEE